MTRPPHLFQRAVSAGRLRRRRGLRRGRGLRGDREGSRPRLLGPRVARGSLPERLRSAWRLLREFAGERAYEIYLEHRRRHHPGEPVMSEREFWRRHFDSRGRNPGTRCC
ncbi:YbdD/YjiX family protein [Thermomonospora sp. CIF 1]|uniref:YbdD/YjiX family protein n=1 Tax=Thermomonospora sp. CIF 1 TaxID=1916083 RepID=UPI000A3EDEDD|nr:YbdD/YjiX family protein [Thermomonospora sp. CIF 1]PKK16180.1 MAG: hypothetical protein BUE48_001660 [Thermomonospora sp. CIF 1]